MTEAEGPVPPELEVTAEELKHVQANVYDHTVLCLPAAYVRAVPGLAPNVSGGYVQNSDDPRVSDVKTLWVGRAAELAAAMGKFKAATAERRAETGEPAASEPGSVSSGDGVAAIEFLANVEPKLAPSDDVRGGGDCSAAKPAVVFVSGSSGVAGDTLRYLRILAAEGHLVLCPDDFCGWPRRLRHRTPRSVRPWRREPDADDARTPARTARGDEDEDENASDSDTDYWSLNLLYAKREAPSGELVYESCAEQYTSSDRLAMVYDTTLAVKHAALTKLLLDLPKPMARRGIYLAGNSEGAIVLGMMDDSMLDPTSETRRMSLGSRPSAGAAGGMFSGLISGLSGLALGGNSVWEAKLLGRINIAYSLEPNYFTYRTIKKSQGEFAQEETSAADMSAAVAPEKPSDVIRGPSRSTSSSPAPPPRGLFGSRWRRDVPTLCVNGSADQFFGRRNSVSEKVIHRSSDSLIKKGDRPNITGDAGQRIAELGMSCAFVAQMEGAKHAMCATHDAALRETLRAFLEAPKECAGIPDRWEREDGERGERWDRTMLWHSVVTPGQCSFASIAATETRAEHRARRSGKNAHGKNALLAVPSVAERKNASPPLVESTRSSRDGTPATSPDASMHGSASFLDLTSSLARLVRPASWTLPASPLALGKASAQLVSQLSGSVPPSPAREGVKRDEGSDEVREGDANAREPIPETEIAAARARPAGLFARLDKWVRKKMAPRK